ncbi:MAG: tetratricopeptide repeat protein [Deltaproteobacteria bacterium]|nr:tetratricopeptide repeat protein [Deltaproteobacteria bacterium]
MSFAHGSPPEKEGWSYSECTRRDLNSKLKSLRAIILERLSKLSFHLGCIFYCLMRLSTLTFIGIAAIALGCSHKSATLNSEISAQSVLDKEEIETKGQALLDRAITHYVRGDFPRAIQEIETSYLLDPLSEDSWARYMLFYCLMATGEYRKALQLAQKLVKEQPYRSLTYHQVGLAQMWSGESTQAIQSFLKALEFDDHTPRVHFDTGVAYSLTGQASLATKAFGEAEKEYTQVLQINPKDFTANFELGSMYLFNNRSIEKVPKHLAAIKESFGQVAEEDILLGKKLYTDFYVLMLEGILHYRNKKAEQSIRTLLEALNNCPSGARADLAELYYYIGQNYWMLGETANARIFFDKSVELDPKGVFANDAQKTLRSIASKVDFKH